MSPNIFKKGLSMMAVSTLATLMALAITLPVMFYLQDRVPFITIALLFGSWWLFAKWLAKLFKLNER